MQRQLFKVALDELDVPVNQSIACSRSISTAMR
jgi:hypothetical protein